MDEYSVEYVLENPVTYHCKGEKREGQMIVLHAPTAKQNRIRQQLQQSFVRALRSLRNTSTDANAEAGSSDAADMTSSDVLSILMMSDIDLYEFNELFKKLLFDGAGMIEGDEKITSRIYEDFSAYDCDKLLGEYMAAFISALALKLMSGK